MAIPRNFFLLVCRFTSTVVLPLRGQNDKKISVLLDEYHSNWISIRYAISVYNLRKKSKLVFSPQKFIKSSSSNCIDIRNFRMNKHYKCKFPADFKNKKFGPTEIWTYQKLIPVYNGWTGCRINKILPLRFLVASWMQSTVSK